MQPQEQGYRIISMMSGTSLDGIDFACCFFKKRQECSLSNEGFWSFQLQHSYTYPYKQQIVQIINRMQMPTTTFLEFKSLEIIYTEFVTELILRFIAENNISAVDYLALHGHTIFHRPQQKITVQITNLSQVAAITHLNVIGNFRQLDVFRGGEGAPLAPYGQEIFQGDIFLNFGGIANVGYQGKGYDINYCNLVLNHLAQLIEGLSFDEKGKIGKTGSMNSQVLSYLNTNWKNSQGVSLEREKAEVLLSQLKNRFAYIQNRDHLTTYYSFLASEISLAIKELVSNEKAKSVQNGRKLQVVCTGGGTKNDYLIELLKKQVQDNVQLIIPSQKLIDFKEAVLFGFLGVKYLQNVANCSSGIGGMLVKGQNSDFKAL